MVSSLAAFSKASSQSEVCFGVKLSCAGILFQVARAVVRFLVSLPLIEKVACAKLVRPEDLSHGSISQDHTIGPMMDSDAKWQQVTYADTR